MATQLQMRRGTQSEHSSFTGAEGEVSVNTTNDSLHVHDGSTASGFELARVDGSNWSITNAISTTANISFGDNAKAIFGAGSDLQIYHDGTRNYIDSDTTELRLQTSELRMVNSSNTEVGLKAVEDGAVTLYYDANAKLATTSTGIDVTGTATMDGLTVDGTANFNSNNVVHTAATPNYVLSESDVTDENTQFLQASGTLRIRTVDDSGSNVAERLRIDHGTGDISFYNSSGTSQSLFWDASAESLGIGTSSPSTALHIVDTTGDMLTLEADSAAVSPNIVFKNNDGEKARINSIDAGELYFGTGASGTERMRIDSSGNVGIGGTSTGYKVHVFGNESMIRMQNTGSGTNGFLDLAVSSTVATINANYSTSAIPLRFLTGAAERMRIDASGNLLVGTTNTNPAESNVNGISLASDGRYFGGATSNEAMRLNRKSTNGKILIFHKDGTEVGSISTNSNSLPSDRNFKRNIQDLSLGLNFISSLEPVTYNYKIDDDGAPVMTGLIAQDVEIALAAAGVEANSMTLLQHNPTEDEKESDYQLDYLKLVPVLINAVKELTERLEQLENN